MPGFEYLITLQLSLDKFGHGQVHEGVESKVPFASKQYLHIIQDVY